MSSFLGIDPGISGGWAFLAADGSEMFFGKFESHLDLYELIKENSIALCGIEKVHGHPAMSVKSVTTFMKNYGGLLAILEVTETPHILIPPTRWQNKIIGSVSGKGAEKKKNTKKRALHYAKRRFPSLKVKHDGVIDALCIAEFTRMKHLGGE